MNNNKAGKNWQHKKTFKKPTRRQIDATLEYFKHLADKEDSKSREDYKLGLDIAKEIVQDRDRD